MARYLITAPTAEVVTVAEVRAMLGMSDDDPADDLLQAMIDAVVATLDPASGGWLGRALASQTWELQLEDFTRQEITLPYPPLISVTSVKYDDDAGVEQTLVETTDYRVFGIGGLEKGEVQPPYNDIWPVARPDEESVRIRYVCGYATAVPQPIKAAIALGVKQLQSTSERNLFLAREDVPSVLARQWVVSDAAGAVITRTIENLLSTYRVWG